MSRIPGQHQIILFILFACMPLYSQRVPLTLYTAGKGLPQEQVSAMLQDSKGYLWLGTYSGLTRFNGNQWDHYDTSRGLLKNAVESLALDYRGRLLISFKAGGIQRMDGNRLEMPSEAPELEHITANGFLADKPGVLYISSQSGLYSMEGNTLTRLPQFTGAAGVFGLTRDPKGRPWFFHNGKLYYLENGTPVLYPCEGVEGSFVRLILFRDDSMYLGSNRGLFVVNNHRAQAVRVNGALIDGVTGGAVNEKGELWLTTNNQGLIGITADGPFIIDTSRGLETNNLTQLLFDREQNLWFAGEAQFGMYTPGPIEAFTQKHGLPNNTIRAIAETRDGAVWLGTRDGLTRKLPEEAYFQPVSMQGFTHPSIFSIQETASGAMLFGTNLGMTILENGKARPAGNSEFLNNHAMQLVVEDLKGRVWCGSWWGLRQFVDGDLVKVEHPALAGHNVVTAKVAPDGHIWLGTNKGLLRFNPDTGEIKSFVDRFGVIVWALDIDRQGRIWIGTNGLGLFCYDGQKFRSYTRKTGLVDNFIWHVVCSSNGDVWVGHNRGLNRISPENRIDHFNVSDGVVASEQAATAALEDKWGNLWFGSSGGVTRYTPGKEVKERAPPLIYIDRAYAGGHSLTDRAVLAKTNNSIRLQFSGVYFSDVLAYSYRMDGVDDNWSAPSKMNLVTYRNLAAGPYLFRARAVTDSGVWSEGEAAFGFAVQRAFYETQWFMFLAIAAGLALFLGYGRLRTWQVDRRRRLLKETVKARTLELQNANLALQKAQQQLVASAHRAGMAEVATENIHNLGNFLTSFAVSLGRLEETVADDRQERALSMLVERLDDKSGVDRQVMLDQMVKLLTGLRDRAGKRREDLTSGLGDIHGKLGKMLELMKYQRDFSEGPDLLEELDLNELVRENLAIQAGSLEEHRIDVQFDSHHLPLITSSRFKLCNVLAHLFKNAADALVLVTPEDGRRLIIHTWATDIGICCSVQDNGVGILLENRARIFSGHTTKAKEWGFGLHFCANALTGLGGNIDVVSEGESQGAVFSIELPFQAVNKATN